MKKSVLLLLSLLFVLAVQSCQKLPAVDHVIRQTTLHEDECCEGNDSYGDEDEEEDLEEESTSENNGG